MTNHTPSDGFTLPGTPPLSLRTALALSELGWAEDRITAAQTALDAWTARPTRCFARLMGGGNRSAAGAELGCLELWNDEGAWLQVSADAVVSGRCCAPTVPLSDEDAAKLHAKLLPGWLLTPAPRWLVRSDALAVAHFELPGDSARERMEAADVVMRGGLDSAAAAALSTCPAGCLALELRSDRAPQLVVDHPPPRVAAWVLGDERGKPAEQVGCLLAAREIRRLYVASDGQASASWRLA